jgi:Kef-type K+ transport system membrane component KefB
VSFADPLLYRLLPLGACIGVLAFLRWSGLGVAGVGPQSTPVALGFLLVGAFLGGKAAARVRLPRITGYLLVGLVSGPYLLAMLTHDMVAAGKAVEGIAVALIALTAGGEIRLDWLRREIRRIALITSCELLLVASGVLLVVFFGRSLFPFMPQHDLLHAGIIALVFGAVAVANSPTVTIAVIAENAAEGPVSRTVLGVTVLKDVAVIVLFAVTLAVAKNLLGTGDAGELGWTLLRELGGSVLAGIAFGAGIAWFVRHVGRDTPVFVLAVCLAMSQLAAALHLETLLVALTAGLWVENVSDARGDKLIRGIERVSLPVYALFFAAAGAKVDLDALQAMWPLALLLAGVRAVCVWGGTTLGASLANAEPAVRRYAWLGFISQAGVTLALSAIVARAFPDWGAEIQVLIVAMIALHELIGPIGFQFALRRAGEVGKAANATAPSEGRAPDRTAPEGA